MADQAQAQGFWRVVEVTLVTLELVWVMLQAWFATGEAILRTFVPPAPKNVAGEIVLITGTGHGIGREVALRFARLRAAVVCVDINPQGNEETVRMIGQEGLKVHGYECDVTDRAAVMRLAERVRKEVGDVTILVNNAGIMPCRPVLEHTEEEIRAVMEINVIANLWMIQAFLGPMRERNHGHIVSMSSMAGQQGLNNLVPYCGSKYAARGIMEALAAELRQDPRVLTGIKLTTVSPYIVDTGLCHKPKIRFPSTMEVVKPTDAADQIVDAVRREYTEITVPGHLWYLVKLTRIFPQKSTSIVDSFLGAGVHAHDQHLNSR